MTLTPPTKKRYYFQVYLWILRFLKPYSLSFIVITILGIIVSISELYIPKIIQTLIDKVIPIGDMQVFCFYIGVVVLLVIVALVGIICRNRLQIYINENASKDLQLEMLRHLRKLGVAFMERNNVGQILSLLTAEVNSIQEIYRRYIPELIRRTIFVVGSMVFMISLEPRFGFIIVGCILLYYLVGPKIEKKATLYNNQMKDRNIELNAKLYSSVASILELRMFGREEWDKEQVLIKLRHFMDAKYGAILFAYIRGSFRRLSYYLGAIVIVFYAPSLIQNGDMTVGDFAAFFLYYFHAMQGVTSIITLITEQRILMIQASKLYDFTTIKPTIADKGNICIENSKGNIEFREVLFRYPEGKQDIFSNFNLTITPGEKIAFVGGSGSGKSTIIKLLCRFYEPAYGEIKLDGIPLREIPLQNLYANYSIVFQDTYLFAMTIRENIMIANLQASDPELRDTAVKTKLHDDQQKYPTDLYSFVGERGNQLSGGQKQRVGIARAIIKNSPILILDEATSSLDNLSESEIQKALQDTFLNSTVIAVAHRLSTIQHFDRIVVLEGGKIVEMGTYQELLDKKGVFHNLAERNL